MSPVRAEIVVDLAAIRHNVRRLRELVAPAAVMTVVKADGYGHGMVESAAPPARAAPTGSAWPPSTRPSRSAPPATPGALLAWLGVPGEDYAAAVAADVDVTAYTLAELDEIRDGAADGRSPGPAAAQDRHRALPRRQHPRRLADPRRRGPRGRGARRLAGHRHLVALRVQRRARAPGQRRAGDRLPRRPRRRRRRRPASRGPPPGQLGRRDPAPRGPLRPRAVRAGVVRPRSRTRRDAPTSACGPR